MAAWRGTRLVILFERSSLLMIKDFNVSEKGHGSYWLLGILRWVMVLIFASFGMQKFTAQSAQGIALHIFNNPFVSWLSIFEIRGEAYLLGTVELTTAALLCAGAFIPSLSAVGLLMGIGTFAITWSFSSRARRELVGHGLSLSGASCLAPRIGRTKYLSRALEKYECPA
jgi:uncharacterized membrane protein YkgB